MKDWSCLVKELQEKEDKYTTCQHIFFTKPIGFTATGRFGGKAISLYKCKKCGMITSSNNN